MEHAGERRRHRTPHRTHHWARRGRVVNARWSEPKIIDRLFLAKERQRGQDARCAAHGRGADDARGGPVLTWTELRRGSLRGRLVREWHPMGTVKSGGVVYEGIPSSGVSVRP